MAEFGSKSSFLSQFKVSLWKIALSNMIRKTSFHMSTLMGACIVAVCLYWPTLGLEVIIGGKLLHETARCTPSNIDSSTIMIGHADGEENATNNSKLKNVIDNFASSIKNLEYCGDESSCELTIDKRTDPRKSPHIFQKDLKNTFYFLLVQFGANEYPFVMLKVPFEHTFSIDQIKGSLLPFKAYLDQLVAKYFNNVTESSVMSPIQFGWKQFLKGQYKRVDTKYTKVLSKYSSGVMATHVYIGMVCVALQMSWALVSDKETGMRSLLSVMGMRRIPYLLSHLLIYQIICVVLSVYGTVLVIVWNDLINSDLRTYSTYLYVLANYMAVGYLVLSQSFIMSTLVGFSRIVTFLNLVVHCFQMIVSMTILKFQLDNLQEGKNYKTLPLLDYAFPVIGFINVQIELFTGSSATDESKPVWRKILFILCMSAFNNVLGIYLDMCFSSGTGHTYKWYFPITYIFNGFKKTKQTKDDQVNKNNDNIPLKPVKDDAPVEDVNENIVKIILKNIRKVFNRRVFCRNREAVAVRNVSLKIQEGMITAILGHNGAGKTTLFNMLIGLLRPTSGSVSIYGLDPSNSWDKTKLNQITSVCMQFDVLFPNMTCAEHMKLFGVYKGLKETEIKNEIDTLFEKLDLIREKDNRVDILSGGQLRKLCVALALLGNPKIVLLDEPTSGVDPLSRRCIWSVLKEYKMNRVIILITHYMDEADILADWKAIIVKGTVACYGTSMFLKKKFDLGYVFTCTVKSDVEYKEIESLYLFILQLAPSTFYKKRHGMEVTFCVDDNEIITFCQLISTEYGSSKLKGLGVLDYGISVTKLEEIFLKLGDIELELFDNSSLNRMNEIGHKAMARLSKSKQIDAASSLNLENAWEVDIDKNVSGITLSTIDKVPLLSLKKDMEAEIMSKSTTRKQSSLTTDDLEIKISKNSYFKLGIFQLFTFIRLNILLALRSPIFAVLRTVGPFSAVTIAALLFKFEMSYKQEFPQYDYFNDSLNSPMYWPTYLFYNFDKNIKNSAKSNFLSDIDCVRQLYGYATLNVHETSNFEFSQRSIYLTVNNYSNPKNFDITFNYYSKQHFRFIFPIQSMLQNCLFNRQFKKSSSYDGSVMNFFSTFSSWRIVWAETFHPSFKMISAFVYLMALSASFSLMNPVVAGDVVRDRMLQNLEQMKLYGLHFMSYWSSHFILHQLHFIMILCTTILAMYTAGNTLFTSPASSLVFAILYFLSSLDTILVIYIVSFIFTDIATAEIASSFSILFPMFILAIVVFFPLQFIWGLHIVFISIMPFLNPWITMMLLDFRLRRINHFHLQTLHYKIHADFKELLEYEPVFNSIIIHIIHIILATVVFIFINIYIFHIKNKVDQANKIVGLIRHKSEAGPGSLSQTIKDMVQQANQDIDANKAFIDQVIQENKSEGQIVAIVSDMTKLFKGAKTTKVAISHVNLVINKGEVFGLLGPSGAGKTTSLNCMSHMMCLTSGEVVVYDPLRTKFISGATAVKESKMGMCPQTNPIWMNLTVNEHLLLYSAIRAIPRNTRYEHSKRLIQLVHLNEYINTRAGELSGGCKRRLSLAISFTGDPFLILLDEPSCGVDPKSRRNLWDTISNAIHNTNRGAIITTQFMEECEALCNRLAILVNGRIMCIGSPQELKSKFGRGMNVEIKMPLCLDKDANLKLKDEITKFIQKKYPKLFLVEYFGERITYRIPKSSSITFGEVFSTIHEAKEKFHLEDYAVSQPTLEQIYFDFARFQTNEDLRYDVQVNFRN